MFLEIKGGGGGNLPWESFCLLLCCHVTASGWHSSTTHFTNLKGKHLDHTSIKLANAVCTCTDLVLRLSTRQEIPTGDGNVIDLDFRYNKVIFYFWCCWGFSHTKNLNKEVRIICF